MKLEKKLLESYKEKKKKRKLQGENTVQYHIEKIRV